jgi:quercetin dioxygenase-like cupin family protein
MNMIDARPRPHRFIRDLLAEAPIPARGILSQTLSDDDDVRLVVFSFAAGEELSEHTAARPAIVHILAGDADVVADGEVYAAAAGSWLRMAAGTSHAIRARSGMVMALYLLPGRESPKG